MKFSMTGQEKGDLLIQVTAWAGLTTCEYKCKFSSIKLDLNKTWEIY